jgi:catechol 2,3-dioxygenase-like lactoylglutathione lyase family enzyme
MIEGLDHVQLAMPRGGEDRARAYFGGMLGLQELEKPASLARRGGVWFLLPDGRQIHLGVEEPFRSSEKAHPALVCTTLDDLGLRLGERGHPVRWDDELAPRRRFYSEDPFGNRLEFLEPVSQWA